MRREGLRDWRRPIGECRGIFRYGTDCVIGFQDLHWQLDCTDNKCRQRRRRQSMRTDDEETCSEVFETSKKITEMATVPLEYLGFKTLGLIIK